MLFKLFKQEVAMRPLSLEWVQQSVPRHSRKPHGTVLVQGHTYRE